SATHIQWRYEGETSWQDLVALADLKGEKGDPGEIPDVEDFLTEEDLAGYVTSGDLSSALSGKADTAHTHEQSDIIGLSTALNAKVGSGNSSVTGIEYYDSVDDLPAEGTTGVIYVVPVAE